MKLYVGYHTCRKRVERPDDSRGDGSSDRIIKHPDWSPNQINNLIQTKKYHTTEKHPGVVRPHRPVPSRPSSGRTPLNTSAVRMDDNLPCFSVHPKQNLSGRFPSVSRHLHPESSFYSDGPLSI